MHQKICIVEIPPNITTTTITTTNSTTTINHHRMKGGKSQPPQLVHWMNFRGVYNYLNLRIGWTHFEVLMCVSKYVIASLALNLEEVGAGLSQG